MVDHDPSPLITSTKFVNCLGDGQQPFLLLMPKLNAMNISLGAFKCHVVYTFTLMTSLKIMNILFNLTERISLYSKTTEH